MGRKIISKKTLMIVISIISILVILFTLFNIAIIKNISKNNDATIACENKEIGDSCEFFVNDKIVEGSCEYIKVKVIVCKPNEKG